MLIVYYTMGAFWLITAAERIVPGARRVSGARKQSWDSGAPGFSGRLQKDKGVIIASASLVFPVGEQYAPNPSIFSAHQEAYCSPAG